MNVSLQNIDKVSALLTVKLEKADYQEKVDKSLKKLRQKAQVPGFRPGMVPMSLVKKMYGKSVIAEEVNKALSEAVKGLEDGDKLADSPRLKKKNLYLMAYLLSGQKLMQFDGKEFRTVGEFADYMKSLLDDSYDKFEEACHRLIDYDDNLDVQFESWLLALGKKKELNAWREAIQG